MEIDDRPENTLARAGYEHNTWSVGVMQDEHQWLGRTFTMNPK